MDHVIMHLGALLFAICFCILEIVRTWICSAARRVMPYRSSKRSTMLICPQPWLDIGQGLFT